MSFLFYQKINNPLNVITSHISLDEGLSTKLYYFELFTSYFNKSTYRMECYKPEGRCDMMCWPQSCYVEETLTGDPPASISPRVLNHIWNVRVLLLINGCGARKHFSS